MGLASVCWILLGAGAVLAVVGGVGACAYNGRVYNNMQGYKRQLEGSYKKPLDCALSSAIIGVFRAVVAIAALALLIVGLPKLIVAILFIVSAVLYLGELISEAILLDAFKYGAGEVGVYLFPADKYECTPSSKLVEWNTKYTEWLATIPTEARENWNLIRDMLNQGYGYGTGYCWQWDEMLNSWRTVSVPGSCLLDFTKTTIPNFNTESDCDKITIGATECVGGWSASAVTSEVKKQCKAQFKASKEELEMTEEWGTDVKGLNSAIREKDAKKTMSEQVESYPSSVYLANSIILGVQTVAFVASLVGVILHFISGGGKDVTEEP